MTQPLEPAPLLGEQPADLAAVLYVLQKAAAPMPVEVVCKAGGLTCAALRAAAASEPLAPVLTLSERDLLATTYSRPVSPQPVSPVELLSHTLDVLLAHVDHHGPHVATRDQIENVLALASIDGVRRDVVGRVFGIMHKALKRLGDKRLMWHAAELSLAAVRRENRYDRDARAEAVALICGRSWVLQRVNWLDDAKADAERSLEIGAKLKWHRNTAFCLKCLGRLSRLQAAAASSAAARQEYLADSERYLTQAINEFTRLDEFDTEEKVGECYSLLGQTWLVAGRLKEARGVAAKAESRLRDTDSKAYLDLQMLRGDLVVRRDPRLAESFYTQVTAHGAKRAKRDAVPVEPTMSADARYAEIKARAFYGRGLCRLAQQRRAEAKHDFETAAGIWTHLQDPAVSLAEWGVLRCDDRLPIDPTLLESEPPAVRVRVIRNHQEQLRAVGARAARRNAPVETSYVARLVAAAGKEIAVEELDWVSRITNTST